MLSFQASTKTFWTQETAHLPARASLLNSLYYWLRNNLMYLLFLWDLQAQKSRKMLNAHVLEMISHFHKLIFD